MTPVVSVCIILYFQDNDVQHNKKSPRKVTKQFFNLLSQQLFSSRSAHAITHIADKDSKYLYLLCSTKGEKVVHNLFVHGLFNKPLKFSMPYEKRSLLDVNSG